MAFKKSSRRKRYSAAEKRAYHIGFGVGLTGEYNAGLTRKFRDFLSPSELTSYTAGYGKGE